MEILINGKSFISDENENLLALMRDKGFDIAAPCGGSGICGKCRVKIENPKAPCGDELAFLSADEILNGIRLACMTKAFDGMSVIYENTAQIIAAGAESKAKICAESVEALELTAVADIGTTTVVAALVDVKSGSVIDSISMNNAQAAFGADIMTRIKNSSSDGGKQHELITRQLGDMIKKLAKKNGLGIPEKLYIAGNTTMLHLFFGADCASLGVYPYNAVFLDSQTARGAEIGMGIDISVTSLPCIASFIGADISAGVLCNPAGTKKYKLLVDLGTNAEIVLYNNEKYFASSAAAGPAFEGANIRCGTAAIPGAICGFSIKDDEANYATIRDVLPPSGICGSGLIDLTAELLKTGIIDNTGLLLCDSYVIEGGTALYPEDIRELQLAKSAICSVIEMLVKSAEIEYNDVENVFLSGGFGSYINANNAAAIGLIPQPLDSKTLAIGNSSLAGCILYAMNDGIREKAREIAESVKALDLSKGEEFSERFIENMMFGEAEIQV